MRTLPILTLLLGVGFLNTSADASVVYSNSADFMTALEPGFGVENFNGIPRGPTPSPLDLGALTVSSTSNLFPDLGVMTTAARRNALTVGEFATPINAFGAFIWNTAVNFDSLPGDINVVVTYADATTDSFLISSATSTTFWGISAAKSLTSLTFTSSGYTGGFNPFVTMDNAIFGTMIPASPVPEPATISLMALAGLGGLALRKRIAHPSQVA